MKRLYLFFIALVLIAGCSGGGSPVVPEKSTGSLDSIPIIGVSEMGGVTQAIGLLGVYELSINPEDLTAELTSKRLSAIGDSYIVSGVAFFTVAPCPNCLQIVGVSLDLAGNAVLIFEVTHPFDPGILADPPSAVNRNDLDVFDLAMVVLPTGGTPQTFSQTGVDAYNATCVNADGYTTELADFLSDNAAMPYFLCVDDSIDASPPVSTWNEFPMGGSVTFEACFDISMPIVFDTYLTMGYGHSAAKPDRLTPKYYNPEFNRKAAWKVNALPPAGTTIGTTWDTLDVFPQDVVVEVYDWQIGATVATAADFGDAATDEVFAASEPSEVTVEVLGMSAALPTANAPDDPSATGLPDDPWIYTIPVPHDNATPLAPGVYPGLVCVTDSRVPVGAPPADQRDYLIDSPDGIMLDFYDIDVFATYQTFWATVVLGCGPITGSILSPSCPVTGVVDDSTVNFIVDASSANGGDPIVLYEIMYDYDGVPANFLADDSNPSGTFTAGPYDNPNCGTPPEDPVTYTTAFRATDSCVPPNETIFATCDVTVDNCCSTPTITTIDVRGFGTTALPCNHPAPTVEITGSGFDGDGSTSEVEFRGTSTYVANTIVSNGTDTITCGIDLSGAALGTYDLYVKNDCGSDVTSVGLITVTLVNQTLTYDFASGCSVWLCQGWQAGGCSLGNQNRWGCYKFCNYGNVCGFMPGYHITSGGDGSSCTSYRCDYLSHDWNIVSPSITLPSSSNSTFRFDQCRANNTWYARFYAYISTNGCSGPWYQIYYQSYANGCYNDVTVPISSYSGSDVRFRFRHTDSYSYYSCGSCGNAGSTIDNIIISGTFGCVLED
jgi:hypothetical protein